MSDAFIAKWFFIAVAAGLLALAIGYSSAQFAQSQVDQACIAKGGTVKTYTDDRDNECDLK